MVRVIKCSYCGKKIPPGTGMTYVKNNGEIFNFCTKKCRKLQIVYKKTARKVRWTTYWGKK